MLITYDARSLDPRSRHGGVGVVLSNLLKRLSGRFDLLGLALEFASPVPEILRAWWRPYRKLDLATVKISPWLAPKAELYWGPNHCLPATVRGPSVIMVAAAGVSSIASFLGYGMTAARIFRMRVPVIAASTATTVLFSLILIPRIGLGGAAYALFLGACAQMVGCAVVLHRAMQGLSRRR